MDKMQSKQNFIDDEVKQMMQARANRR
jgi:hypothetical protein